MIVSTALQWPALETDGRAIQERIEYERGVWGKAHGARSDFRWIASTAAFLPQHERIRSELSLGREDVPSRFTAWRATDGYCCAMSCYQSTARDASGRTDFVEEQIAVWKRTPGLPAAVCALLLLPEAAKFEPISVGAQSGIQWSKEDAVIGLGETANPPLAVTLAAIEASIATGLLMLTTSVSRDALAELYASLLAGARGISFPGLTTSLPQEAIAALLLPLPRTIADRISIAGWLPSSPLAEDSLADVRRCWDVVAGGETQIPPDPASRTATADDLRQANAMADAVFAGAPGALAASAALVVPRALSPSIKPFRLTLWGPSAAGKTALLAILFLRAPDADWEIFPTKTGETFTDLMQESMISDNAFPKATTVGHIEAIEYLFHQKKTGVSASLVLEDRAGRDFEYLDDGPNDAGANVTNRLGSADGLVLLFDPLADPATLEKHVSRTLKRIHIESGRGIAKDERPIAVCVSKADVLIQTADDYRCAVETPDDFVRSRVPAVLTAELDRYCVHYRLFPVSVATIRLRYGVIRPSVFLDEELRPRICPGDNAFNLMKPFSWLIGELTA